MCTHYGHILFHTPSLSPAVAYRHTTSPPRIHPHVMSGTCYALLPTSTPTLLQNRISSRESYPKRCPSGVVSTVIYDMQYSLRIVLSVLRIPMDTALLYHSIAPKWCWLCDHISFSRRVLRTNQSVGQRATRHAADGQNLLGSFFRESVPGEVGTDAQPHRSALMQSVHSVSDHLSLRGVKRLDLESNMNTRCRH